MQIIKSMAHARSGLYYIVNEQPVLTANMEDVEEMGRCADWSDIEKGQIIRPDN